MVGTKNKYVQHTNVKIYILGNLKKKKSNYATNLAKN